jgi:hypothetical protein
MYETLLKLCWLCFHLCFLHRSGIVFPIVPGHPRGCLTCLEVQTVEVGQPTVLKPPTTCAQLSTVNTTRLIIVLVFGGELHSVMITQRITSSTLKYNLSTEVFILRKLANLRQTWVDGLINNCNYKTLIHA